MIETWRTPERLAAKLAEFEAALAAHWERPLAWAIMHEEADKRIVVDRACQQLLKTEHVATSQN